MSRLLHKGVIFHAGLLTLLAYSQVSFGQADQSRRELATPGLMLDTGSRTAACDVLTFTNNGQYLLATGDDKVVRTWKFTAQGLEPIVSPAPAGVPQPVLRWTIQRERRGNIYAAAVSPDPRGALIAIGGTGIRNSQFAVLDRYSGEIQRAVPYLSTAKEGGFSIWSVAFAPNQTQVACGTDGGGVWLWDWKAGKQPTLIGQHHAPQGADGNDLPYNYVRFLAYHDKHLVSADEHGGVYYWNLQQPIANNRAQRFTFKHAKPGVLIRSFAMSPDGQWLAAALESNKVEILSMQTGASKTIILPVGNRPNTVAFNPESNQLAISVRVVDVHATFFKEIAHYVRVHDLDSGNVLKEITPSYRVEALAFHPDGKHLATAGGNNHDVSVYDLAKPAHPLAKSIAGPGQCIWGVSLSIDEDGRYLGFQSERNTNPDHPNRQGSGKTRVFDLQSRVFTDKVKVKWSPPVETSADGWQVLFSTAKVKRADQWFVQGPGNAQPIPIPLETKDHEFPRCYAFLPKTADGRQRLVLGHMWGASIYEIEGNTVRRTRILTGHDGNVSALAVSPDGKKLVTASRDQTIAGWSLEDWPSHPQLGANLSIKEGKLWVGTVDTGSPIWEAGLSTDDEIVLLVIDRKIIYNRSGKYGKDTGDAQLALKAMQNPTAGIEIYFGWKRAGNADVLEQLTFLRDRPIWRFPTKDNEWVLWRYQDFLYDTSTGGDSLIGWQRNSLTKTGGFDLIATPAFYHAEQFRNSYHQPAKVTQTIQNWGRTAQAKSSFIEIEPPVLDLKVDGMPGKKEVEIQKKGLTLSVRVTPNSDRQNQELTRVILWINDYQLMEWENAALQKQIKERKNTVGLTSGVFEIDGFPIPADALRHGKNIVFVQAYNKADVRGESDRIQIANPTPRPASTLHGLFVGVGDYSKSVPQQPKIAANDDAEVLAEVWESNRGKLYPKANVRVLKNAQVTSASVLKQLDTLAKIARPDDLLVFHLGGHGVAKQALVAGIRKAKLSNDDRIKFEQQIPALSPFLFLCGDFHFLKIRDTTISLDDLHKKLVKLPCRKLILLDACNSGAVNPEDRKGTDIIRLLTKDGVGPIIFSACKAEEFAWELRGFIPEPAHGLFAQAIIKGIQEDFAASKKMALYPTDLQASVKASIEPWVQKLRKDNPKIADQISQTPQVFLPPQERTFDILNRQE